MKVLLALLAVISVAAALAPLLNHDAADKIEGQYIVVLHKNLTVAHRDAHVHDLMTRRLFRGEHVIRTFDIGDLIGYSARFGKDTLASELAHPNILYIEQDQVVRLFDERVTQQNPTWGIDRIDQAELPLDKQYHHWTSNGSDVTAYIIDTGIRTSHLEFRNEQTGGSRAQWGYNSVPNEPDTDGNGHGTHVAGTVGGTTYGVAKNVTLVAVKVLSAGGSGSWEGVIAGVDWVTKHHAGRGARARSVANMSLGGGATPTLDTAVNNSINSGINYAIAAGNSYGANACSYSPARVPQAVTVGSTMNTDARSGFSNIGPCVKIFAPGEGITSSWHTSDTATNTISGTSMASPHVAGAIAVYLSHLMADGDDKIPTPKQVETYLNQTSTPNKVTNPGTGSPNQLLLVESAYKKN